MPKLDGKIAVITGGNSGIGLATAKGFMKEGARGYFTGRREADLDRLYSQIHREVGRVDVVFANAGFAALAPLGSLTEEHVDNLLDVNVKGVIWTVQKALPLMGPGGSIILNASIVS